MLSAIFALSLLSSRSFAGLEQGYLLVDGNEPEKAAQFFCSQKDLKKDDAAEALAMCGRLLDQLADMLSERAEKKCYWVRSGDPSCMMREADALSARFGAGSFAYEHSILFVSYTGAQYRQILEKYPKSKFAPEAEFYLLLRGMVGHPDAVLPKINSFLAKHPSGEWNRKGLLLLARANQDIWFVHNKWSWVLYNNQLAEDELIIRSQKYRQAALAVYEKLIMQKNSFEGQIAKREYDLLKQNVDDGVLYTIVSDSSAGTLDMWGIGKHIVTSLPTESAIVDAPTQTSIGGEPADLKQPKKRSK